MDSGDQVSGEVIVRQGERVIYRKLGDGDGGVLLHLDTAAYHGVNEFGAFVWDRIGPAGRTFDQLLEVLDAEVENAPSGWQGEVAAFLRDLERRDLLSLTEPSLR